MLDFSSLGPGPFTSMVLADLGAEVVSVQAPSAKLDGLAGWLGRGKTFVSLDLRDSSDVALATKLANGADVVLEAFRPGVMERLGLGPSALCRQNPRLIYVRLTGWGQDGPYASRAGHDLNFLAVSGLLSAWGDGRPSLPPPAVVGDLAAGSLSTVSAVLSALFVRERLGAGTVIDCSILDGALYLMTALFGERASGQWSGQPETHVLSGNAPFYALYQCRDGRWFSVAAIEPKFYAAFLRVLGLHDVPSDTASQMDMAEWPALKRLVAQRFAERDVEEWTRAFAEADACGAPVHSIDEVAADLHVQARDCLALDAGFPMPRMPGRTCAPPRLASHPEGEQMARRRLRGFGLSIAQIADISLVSRPAIARGAPLAWSTAGAPPNQSRRV